MYWENPKTPKPQNPESASYFSTKKYVIIETCTASGWNKISCYLFWWPRYLSISKTVRVGDDLPKVFNLITREPRSPGSLAVLRVTLSIHDCCLSSALVSPFLRLFVWSWQSCYRLADRSELVDFYERRILHCVDFSSLTALVRKHSFAWW